MTGTTFTDTTVEPSTTYGYVVIAVDAPATGPALQPLEVTTDPAPDPVDPGSLFLASTSDAGVKGNRQPHSVDVGRREQGGVHVFRFEPGPATPTASEDVFVKDLATGDITLVSTSDTGVKGRRSSPSLSGDGTMVAFVLGGLEPRSGRHRQTSTCT